MNEQDFNKLNEIAKELNEIRLRNNLTQIQLTSELIERRGLGIKYNEVCLLTRGEDFYKDCKFAYLKEYEDYTDNMNYDKYINYK